MFYLWYFDAPIASCVHGKWKLEYQVVWHLTSLRQANIGNDMKNILYIWFSHFTHLNRDTSVLELFPVIVFKKKNSPLLTHILAMNQNRLKNCRLIAVKIRNMFILMHIIANLANITVFYSHFPSPTDQKYWKFYYHPPGKFRYTMGRSLKRDAENSTPIYIYLTLSIIDMDFLYQ